MMRQLILLLKSMSFKSLLSWFKQKRNITSSDMMIFWRQFATLFAAHIPLIQVCDILEKSQTKVQFRTLIQTIKRELLSGKNLFHSLYPHKRYFDELSCQLIRIGEHTGRLDFILCTIANHQEQQLAFKRKIKQALFYPCMIIIIALLLTFFMLIFIIPRFADLFDNANAKLPLLTVWIFFLSAQLNQHLFLLLISMLSISVVFYFLFTTYCKKAFQPIVTQLPFIYPCIQKILLARFARNLAITFNAGIPIKEALRLSGSHFSHHQFNQLIAILINKVNAGMPLHHAMTILTEFPVMMIQMIKIGEETGLIDQMLGKIADFFESEIDLFLSQLGLILEPLIMLLLGVLIGGLVIGMYLPIFNLGSAL